MKEKGILSFSMGFRLFLNCFGILSAALLFFLLGVYSSSPGSGLNFNKGEIAKVFPFLIGVLFFVSVTFILIRIKTSYAYKGMRLPFILDASGVNSFLTGLLENSNIGIFVSDFKTGAPLFVNRFMKSLLENREVTDLKGWNGDLKTPPYFMALESAGRSMDNLPGGTWGWDGKSGIDEKWYSVRACKLQWVDGRPVVFQTAYCIDSLKKMEADLSGFARECLREREAELKRISSNIHEQVAQDLASLRIAIDTACYGLDEIPDKLAERIRNMSVVLQDAISHLREIAYGLTPIAMGDFGIEKAIKQYCSEFSEKSGVRVSCVCSGIHSLSSDCEISIGIFRIMQEIVTKISEMTSPAHIRISLVFSSTRIIVKFESDGRGYDVGTATGLDQAENELGLNIIRQRIRLLNGNGLRINSGKSMGVLLSFEIFGNFTEICKIKTGDLVSAGWRDDFINSATESRPYKTSTAKKILLFCKDGKNDSEPRHPDQYQSHVRWRR